MLLHGGIEQGATGVPTCIQVLVNSVHFRRVNFFQKDRHGPHHMGVCIESTTCKTNVCGSFWSKPLHQISATTHHAHGKAAAQCFAIGHHIGLHTKIGLSAAFGQSETQKNFIKNQHNATLGTDLPKGL